MSEEYGLKFVVNGEDYDKIKKSLNEQIEDLQQKVEKLEKENASLKEANNYLQEVINSMKEPENAHHYHLENIKLRARNKQLESIRKEAIEYMKEFIFEPLLISEDRKLIMFNENLKNFENILSKGDNNVKD